MNSVTIGHEAALRIDEGELWRRHCRLGDPSAREELLWIYLPLAKRMARRYAGVSEPYDDLVQVASLGLLNAIDRFDPDRGTPFGGFAKPTIMGELKRHFRDKVWAIRVPRSIHDNVGRIEKATEELELELRRSPSVTELAQRLDLRPSEILEALEAQHNRRSLSLSRPITEDEAGSSAEERIGAEDPAYDLVEGRMTLEALLPGLDRREREVLKMRFVDELPQTKIAERLGCSQMHVSRLLRRTLERLREGVGSDGVSTAPAPGGENDGREAAAAA